MAHNPFITLQNSFNMSASVKKSQEESEQPAKVYQLDALNDKVDTLTKQTENEFNKIQESLKTLLLKSETQVTPQQLNDNILALDKKFQTALDDEVKKIHLEYRPVKKNIGKTLWLVAGIVATVIGQLIMILLFQQRNT